MAASSATARCAQWIGSNVPPKMASLNETPSRHCDQEIALSMPSGIQVLREEGNTVSAVEQVLALEDLLFGEARRIENLVHLFHASEAFIAARNREDRILRP